MVRGQERIKKHLKKKLIFILRLIFLIISQKMTDIISNIFKVRYI